MVSYSIIYKAFLGKVSDDEWDFQEADQIEEDLRLILEGALPYFKFPRINLIRDEEGFIANLTNDEIQVIAAYMKFVWVGRSIATWENVKPYLEEREYREKLDKLSKFQASTYADAKALENIYYRSIEGRPFPYRRLADQESG